MSKWGRTSKGGRRTGGFSMHACGTELYEGIYVSEAELPQRSMGYGVFS